MKFIWLSLFVSLVLSGGCKKNRNESCNTDSQCKKSLRCVSHKCRPYINCDKLREKYHKCIKEILTVRNPDFKPTQAFMDIEKKKFDNSFYRECKKDRGAYDENGIEKCIENEKCSDFALCLLKLEK